MESRYGIYCRGHALGHRGPDTSSAARAALAVADDAWQQDGLDPLFLASSVLVKKPSRIVALSLVMVLCPLVYRLAERRLRAQLAATGQTDLNQLKQPTDHSTMRWMLQCFAGISLVRFPLPNGPPHRKIAGLEPFHGQVVA